MKVGSRAPSKPIKSETPREPRIQTVDRKLVLLAKAEGIIRRLSVYKAFRNRPHNTELLNWLADYEKEMGL